MSNGVALVFPEGDLRVHAHEFDVTSVILTGTGRVCLLYTSYVGDSTVNGSIYQTYYQVDAQTRTGVKKISVSGVLYEKGTIGTWQKVSKMCIRDRL